MGSENAQDIHLNVDFNTDYKKLICIQYPGLVNDENKAIETLGGLREIAQIHSSKNRRLQLRFRPKDPYCKVICSTLYPCSGLLLKVRVKKKKRSTEPPVVISTELFGIINVIHKFDTLNDFQFLPMSSNPDLPTVSKNLFTTLQPPGMVDVDWLNTHKEFFFVPSILSRLDYPQKYSYRSNAKIQQVEVPQNVIMYNRKPRTIFKTNICFNHSDPIPMRPDENAAEILTGIKQSNIDAVVNMFEERPVWSKRAVLYRTNLPLVTVKRILLTVAYYYLNGPWRLLWVKFGYDPRKDPSSRIYQNIDFRLRNTGPFRDILEEHRSKGSFNLIKHHNKISLKIIDIAEVTNDVKAVNENVYIFRPNVLPPRRQMFYQYCDLKVPEIEEMLSKLGEVLPGSMCHQRRGWMPSGFDDQCRNIMHDHATNTVRELCNDSLFQSTSTGSRSDLVKYNENVSFDDLGMAQSSSSDSEVDDDDDDDYELEDKNE